MLSPFVNASQIGPCAGAQKLELEAPMLRFAPRLEAVRALFGAMEGLRGVVRLGECLSLKGEREPAAIGVPSSPPVSHRQEEGHQLRNPLFCSVFQGRKRRRALLQRVNPWLSTFSWQ